MNEIEEEEKDQASLASVIKDERDQESLASVIKEEKDQESLASVIIPSSFAKNKSYPYKDNLKGHHIKTFICNLRAPWARNR